MTTMHFSLLVESIRLLTIVFYVVPTPNLLLLRFYPLLLRTCYDEPDGHFRGRRVSSMFT